MFSIYVCDGVLVGGFFILQCFMCIMLCMLFLWVQFLMLLQKFLNLFGLFCFRFLLLNFILCICRYWQFGISGCEYFLVFVVIFRNMVLLVLLQWVLVVGFGLNISMLFLVLVRVSLLLVFCLVFSLFCRWFDMVLFSVISVLLVQVIMVEVIVLIVSLLQVRVQLLFMWLQVLLIDRWLLVKFRVIGLFLWVNSVLMCLLLVLVVCCSSQCWFCRCCVFRCVSVC